MIELSCEPAVKIINSYFQPLTKDECNSCITLTRSDTTCGTEYSLIYIKKQCFQEV